jgi:hypothetical protein
MDAVTADCQHGAVSPLAALGLVQPAQHPGYLRVLAVLCQAGAELPDDLAVGGAGPAHAMVALQGGQGLTLRLAHSTQGGAFGQGGGGAAGDHAELLFQGMHTGLARLARLVHEAAQAHLAEEGGQGAGGLGAAAVAVAVLLQLGGDLLGVVGLDPVEEPFQGGAGQLAGRLGQLLFECTGRLGSGRPATEVLEQLGQRQQLGQEDLGQGEQVVGEGSCQQQGGQRRVSHDGVLPR